MLDSNQSASTSSLLAKGDQALGSDLSISAVDDGIVENQLRRAQRWHIPKWPVAAAAAEKNHDHNRPFPKIAIERPNLEDKSLTFPPLALLLQGVRRNSLSFTTSLSLHCMLMMALGLVTLSSGRSDLWDYHLIGTSLSGETIELESPSLDNFIPSPVEITFTPVQTSDPALVNNPNDSGAAAPVLNSLNSAKRNSGPLGDVYGIFGASGAGMALSGEEQGGGAEFFGVKAAGRKFVFVVDCSKSMAGLRWRDASRELLASIARLDEDKEFYVVFFDGNSHPMFDPYHLESELLPATKENIARMQQWVASVRLGYNTKPCQSVRRAIELQPDAIFLLTDGEFTDPTLRYLRNVNKPGRKGDETTKKVAVHTIGFHSRAGQKVLKQIAKENRGEYRFIPSPQDAVTKR